MRLVFAFFALCACDRQELCGPAGFERFPCDTWATVEAADRLGIDLATTNDERD